MLAGEWKPTEKFGPNENGAAGAGTFSIRNGKEGHYPGFYCGSMQPVGCGEAGIGTWEGKDLVFESATRGPSGTIQMKQRFSGI